MIRSRPCLLTIAFTLISVVFAVAYAQEQQKVVEWANHRNVNSGQIMVPWTKQADAVELEEILVGSKVATIGDPLTAGTDWINDLKFRVKNVSSEDVTWIQITVTLPELTHSPQIQYLAPCGNREKEICLKPGQEAELRIAGGKLYDWVKEQVAKEKEMDTINRAAIDTIYVATTSTAVTAYGCLQTSDLRNTCPHKY